MGEFPIGRRVAYWRGRRRMSQQVFADRLGKSKSWVDKVERGVRRLDKFSVIHDIADVLQVEPHVLLDREPERGGPAAPDQADIGEIQAALERYDQVSAFFQPPATVPKLADLRKAVNHAWLTYQHANGGTLARALPRLLRQAQAADGAYQHTENTAESANLLAQVYQISSSALRNLGEPALAWLAAERALNAAQRADDDLLVGVSSVRVGVALQALGRARAALELNMSLANRLAPAQGRGASPARLSVYGMLLLQGAMAAAKLPDPPTVHDLLSAAEEAAVRLGADRNYYWSCFGPTNVLLHRVAAAVEMGDGRVAVETHDRIRPEGFAALVPERRVHHLLDLARGWVQLGDMRRAGEVLVAGGRLAIDEVTCRPRARELLGNVLRNTPGEPPPALGELAEKAGVGA